VLNYTLFCSDNTTSRKEIEEWSRVMTERIKELRPLIVCFNGKGTYENYLDDKCDWGLQPEPILGTNTVSKTL
jgi:TDG/mug DNA glycosylase family protein